jgi:hypothetical protein
MYDSSLQSNSHYSIHKTTTLLSYKSLRKNPWVYKIFSHVHKQTAMKCKNASTSKVMSEILTVCADEHCDSSSIILS